MCQRLSTFQRSLPTHSRHRRFSQTRIQAKFGHCIASLVLGNLYCTDVCLDSRPDLITPPEWAAILRNNQFLHGFRRGFTDDQKVDMAAAAGNLDSFDTYK